jgi:hypothetical protein
VLVRLSGPAGLTCGHWSTCGHQSSQMGQLSLRCAVISAVAPPSSPFPDLVEQARDWVSPWCAIVDDPRVGSAKFRLTYLPSGRTSQVTK